MIALAGLLTLLALFYSSFTVKERVKEYFILFLMLETGMLGVFMSLDMILFYVFWEVGLVPMFLLIGVWGGQRREYAAIKFFIYTLAGSVFGLLGILAIYHETGTFNIMEAAAAMPFAGDPRWATIVFWALFCRLCHQDPGLPLPHLAAGRPHRGADLGQRDPGGYPAQAGELRHDPHRAADVPGAVLPLLGRPCPSSR